MIPHPGRVSFLLMAACVTATCLWSADPIVVTSPDKTVRAELTADQGRLRYRILVDGKQVLAPSAIGLVADDVDFTTDVVLQAPTVRAIDERYPFRGARSQAVNAAQEAVVPASAHGQPFHIDLHVADGGVGIRLRLPARPGRMVQAERSAWRLDGNPTVWAPGFDAPHESMYATDVLDRLGDGMRCLPITARVGQTYVSITEAALRDYGDLAVRRSAGNVLEGALYADPKGWKTDDEVVQPWRVTIVARDLTALVNTTLVQDLNPPPAPDLASASWIVPGRSTWQWMAIGAPRLDDQHQWVDWTAALQYEYYLVDEGWSKWPSAWDVLAETCAYAKSKGVKVWLWVHSREVKSDKDRQAYFSKAAAIGIVGVKIDFPPPADRWWSTWYHDVARDAAASRLLVDFHGANKPTGMERTWPNVLTREGVRGHEWQMTRYRRILSQEHDTILPFTRYLAGPGDYTPTVFEPKELQGNTWAHELAQAVLFTSPFLCTGGHPRDYLANPAKDVLMAIPAVWDETRVLAGSEPGKVVAMARRSGSSWFVAVINGGEETMLDLSCDFLGGGTWTASRLGDAAGRNDGWDRLDATATAADRIHLELRPKGGFVGWFRK